MPVVQDTDMFYRGSRELARIYRGDHILVWEPGGGHDYSQDYLTLEVSQYSEPGIRVRNLADPTRWGPSFYYSINEGPWTYFTTGLIPGAVGDEVRLKGIRSANDDNLFHVRISGARSVKGNLMSLIYGDSFTGQTQCSASFNDLFSADTENVVHQSQATLEDAGDLVFPENVLNIDAGLQYFRMFRNCAYMTRGPKILPATTLSTYCYQSMFEGCVHLLNAPALPATVLPSSCYVSMFDGCTSLQNAPVLPAQVVEYMCYYRMFRNCTSLTTVKCLATDISATSCLTDWLYNVSPTGTFVKAPGVTYPSGADGIPSGWTIVETQ